MIPEIYLIAVLIILAFTALVLFLNQRLKQIFKNSQTDNKLLKVIESLQQDRREATKTLNELQKGMQQGMHSQTKNISNTLRESTKTLNQRLDNAAKFIAKVNKQVGEMSEIGRSMKDLQQFLNSPKLRGNIGEEVLKDLISQMFPKNSFHLQYSFKSGEKVDAALKTDAGILSIDSKFPMENFQKMVKAEDSKDKKKFKRSFINDVRKHIRAISKKYILPEEGTMDFALMYVPSEAVFYEIVNISEINNYARKHRIYPVSPNTLYAHLQMILLSFEGRKFEAKSKEVFRMLRAIHKNYQKTEDLLQVLGKHINNAYSKFSDVLQGYSLLGQKISSTQAISDTIQEENPEIQEQSKK